jgi:hypothetical protein
MEVCESCHERDIKVTQCKYTLAMHIRYAGWITKCSICGIKGPIYLCLAYGNDPITECLYEAKKYEDMLKMPR